MSVNRGRVFEKGVTPMRSFVVEPMQHERLFLAGDAAHIVPPTGAKGLNTAMADVYLLAHALEAFYDGDGSGLDAYSSRALERVWRVQHFSWWMTSMLHRFNGDDDFQLKLQHSQLRYTVSSQAQATALAENYVGHAVHRRVERREHVAGLALDLDIAEAQDAVARGFEVTITLAVPPPRSRALVPGPSTSTISWCSGQIRIDLVPEHLHVGDRLRHPAAGERVKQVLLLALAPGAALEVLADRLVEDRETVAPEQPGAHSRTASRSRRPRKSASYMWLVSCSTVRASARSTIVRATVVTGMPLRTVTSRGSRRLQRCTRDARDPDLAGRDHR